MFKVFVAFVIACLATAAQAGPLTYDVSRIVAGPVLFTSTPAPFPVNPPQTADYRVDGTITTDGTLGLLSAANIIDWVLRISGGPSALFTGPLSGGSSRLDFARVSAVTATDDALIFDPDLNPPIGSSSAGIGFGTLSRGPAWSLFGPYETVDFGFGRSGPVVTRTAPYAFATIPAAVPEPGPLSLVGAGLLGGLVVRRRVGRRPVP